MDADELEQDRIKAGQGEAKMLPPLSRYEFPGSAKHDTGHTLVLIKTD
jgi:hypothetical protein